MTTPDWPTPPADLVLADDEIHVWRAKLDQPAEQLVQLAQTLAADEQARAARFYFDVHRQRFIAGRGLLRIMLARYLHLPPSSLQFQYGPRGKPALLLPPTCQNPLQFNVSHSHNLALYAFAWRRDVGIDLEYMRTEVVDTHLAERFFAPGEVTALRALPLHLQQTAFFTCWTRKEAYLKATGDGLAQPLHQFEVSLAPDEPARLLHLQGDRLAAARWSLHHLCPADDYVGALAVAGHDGRLSCWQ